MRKHRHDQRYTSQMEGSGFPRRNMAYFQYERDLTQYFTKPRTTMYNAFLMPSPSNAGRCASNSS